MTIIHPITTCLPQAIELWEKTNLPLGCVITPLGSNNGNDKDDNDSITTADVQQQQVEEERLLPLSCIPKCLHCGAPHPSHPIAGVSYFQNSNPYANNYQQGDDTIICKLCLKASSINFEDQYDKRKRVPGENIHPSNKNQYDTYKEQSRYHQQQNQNKKTTTTAATAKEVSCVFKLPLFPSTTTTCSAVIEACPSIICPPLWLIIIDGSKTNNQSYYKHICKVISNAIREVSDEKNMKNTHISIIMSYLNDCIGIWDLQSSIPHIKHYNYNNSSLEEVVEDTTTKATSTNNCNVNNTIDTLSIVPINEKYIPNINNVLKSIVDTAGKITIKTTSGIGSNCNENVFERTTRNRTPYLGRTIEVILDTLLNRMAAIHPGLPLSVHQQQQQQRRRQQQQKQLMYAGGKILCFLSGPPGEVGYQKSSSSSSKQQQTSQSVRTEEEELGMTTASATNNNDNVIQSIGTGGFGGSCAEYGLRYSTTATAKSINSNGIHPPNIVLEDDNDDDDGSQVEEELPVGDPSDITSYNLKNCCPRPNIINIDKYFEQLGNQCSLAALGVDIVVVLTEDDDYDKEEDYQNNESQFQSTHKNKFIGIPYLRFLSERSGSSLGPVIIPFYKKKNPIMAEQELLLLLENEILSRTPWFDNNQSFGGLLRVRLSNSLCIDTSTAVGSSTISTGNSQIDGSGGYTPHLESIYTGNCGMYGPVSLDYDDINEKDIIMKSSSSSSSNPLTTCCWRFGTADSRTTVSLDLCFNTRQLIQNGTMINNRIYLDGYGHVMLRPCIQTTFAYTTIIKNKVTGQNMTVRRIRITTRPIPIIPVEEGADNNNNSKEQQTTESLYSFLNVDVLSIILHHKLTVMSIRDGLLPTQDSGHQWLLSFLICVYESAKSYIAKQQKEEKYYLNQQRHHQQRRGSDSIVTTTFHPEERLLESDGYGNGTLSSDDILVAQGHPILYRVPLILFALLQCDALRPSSTCSAAPTSSYYNPTIDARCAASSQMSSMTSTSLLKCIIPKIELWVSASSPIVSSASSSNIVKGTATIGGFFGRSKTTASAATTATAVANDDDDSKHPIIDNMRLSMESIKLSILEHDQHCKEGTGLLLFLNSPRQIMVLNCQNIINQLSLTTRRFTKPNEVELTISNNLKEHIEKASKSYRVAPPIYYELGIANTLDENTDELLFMKHLKDALIEDSSTIVGLQNYDEWKSEIAYLVQEELSLG